MGRVLRTSEAAADLDSIWGYIAQRNVLAADQLIDKLYARFLLLADYPESGERQPLLADGSYRRIVEGNYIVYYCPDEAGVIILRVLHGARDETPS
ncbi:type II toxin-antitoxin system RelE/ParE family toxin [Lacipirellula sp.]|uniref:type II toxin-antitoxin system RelE/ParE family toxin n=1 Tax=Lacipirellula sp. TaxID=2691419 RepID=UPI003D13E09C